MGSSFEFRDNYPDNGIYPGYSRAAVIPIPDSWSRRLSWIGIRVLLPYPILFPLFLNSPHACGFGLCVQVCVCGTRLVSVRDASRVWSWCEYEDFEDCIQDIVYV